jgi:hypothetical protein
MQLQKHQLLYIPFSSEIYYISYLICPASPIHPRIKGHYYPILDKFIEITHAEYFTDKNI